MILSSILVLVLDTNFFKKRKNIISIIFAATKDKKINMQKYIIGFLSNKDEN